MTEMRKWDINLWHFYFVYDSYNLSWNIVIVITWLIDFTDQVAKLYKVRTIWQMKLVGFFIGGQVANWGKLYQVCTICLVGICIEVGREVDRVGWILLAKGSDESKDMRHEKPDSEVDNSNCSFPPFALRRFSTSFHESSPGEWWVEKGPSFMLMRFCWTICI